MNLRRAAMKRDVLSTTYALALMLVVPSSSVAAEPAGNNAEAQSFARDMSTDDGVWSLDLTPEQIVGRDVVDYRKRVTYAKAKVTVNASDWLKASETSQRNMIKTWLDTLHKAPPISMSNVIDYYPNSSGEISIIADGKVVATGKYTKQKNTISLVPGTFKADETNKYTAKIAVMLDKSGGISLNGTANLPDKQILITLSKGTFQAQSKVTPKNGAFSTPVFTDGGRPLPFGKYKLELNAVDPLVEGKATIDVPTTTALTVTFAPTKF